MDDSNSLPPIQIIREPFLIRNPWFSIVMVMIFYFLFQTIPQLIYVFIVRNIPSFLTTYPYITRIIEFVFLGILLLLFIPFLKIPKNNKNYGQYLEDIQFSSITFKSMAVGVIFTVVVFVLALGSVYLSAILSKIYYVEALGIPITEPPGILWEPEYLLDPSKGLNVYYALTPGIMEELAFRGIILVLLLKKYRWKTAIIVDGLLFGFFHLINLIGPSINYFRGTPGWTLDLYEAYIISTSFQVIYAASLGIAWAYLFVKSRSIWPGIFIHWVIDAFGGLILYPNIGFAWIYFPIITLFGIGVLPAILNMFIIKAFYRGEPRNPWEIGPEIQF